VKPLFIWLKLGPYIVQNHGLWLT